MAEIIVYSTGHCPYCVQALALLQRKGVPFQEIRVDKDAEKLEEMIEKSQRRTVPQIFINGQSIGGYTDLYALEVNGQLDELLRG
jgi:glutaredoxin 3